ncbi:TPA: hypothetical protein ACH3X2_002299 [Trebouxia sp. C0005]
MQASVHPGTGSVSTPNSSCIVQFHFQSLEWTRLVQLIECWADVKCTLHLPDHRLYSGESLALELLWIPFRMSYLVLQACGACFQHCVSDCCNACAHKTHVADAVAECHAPDGAVREFTSLNAIIPYMACHAKGLT